MLTIRKSEARGHADHGWLNSFHTFSFANYLDPAHMSFRSLRVINEDRVAPGRGFGAHPHRDMEILTYVLSGKLAHKDSMGHVELLGPNEIQRMSAGSGIVHSEFNGSDTEPVHFFQVWIEPADAARGSKPSYEQLQFDAEEKHNRFKLLASSEPTPGAATLQQDARVSVAALDGGQQLSYPLGDHRHAWLHVVHGDVTVNGKPLTTGDAIAADGESALNIAAAPGSKSEILLFDLS
jgi:quercetin 2,3-dioxygenase